MLHRKLTWTGIALVGALITWSVSAQYQAPAPAQAPYPPDGGRVYFAQNLGIYYRLVPYYGSGYNPITGNYDPSNPPGGGDGAPAQAPYPGSYSYGARLTRYPVPYSPAAYLQLEPGDMIVSLDNLPIYGPYDVESHRFQTSTVFINIRTGMPQVANMYIP